MKPFLTLFLLASMGSSLAKAAESTMLSCDEFRPTAADLDSKPVE